MLIKEAARGFEPRIHGFAGRRLTAWLRRQYFQN